MITIPQSITASRLRLILSITLALLIVVGGAIFYFAYSQLSKTAAETGQQAASARESESTIERLELLKTELEAKNNVVAMISEVSADSQNYYYQDRLVNDLTTYANRANLTITNISFSNAAAAAPSAPVTTEGGTGSTATPGQAPAPTDTTGTAPAVSSLRKATVDITLDNPVNYRDLLNFLHYIEQNLTKLKVSNVSMTKSDDDNVSIDVLNLEVYIR